MDKKTQPTNILSIRDPHQNKRFTKAESEGMEKILCANGHEKNLGSNTYIRLNRLQN